MKKIYMSIMIGMLNITQERFLSLVRSSCTPMYSGAMWHYFDSTTNNFRYFRPNECQFYKQSYDSIKDEIIFKPTTKIKDGKPCYNTNYEIKEMFDSSTGLTKEIQVPIKPFTNTKEK